MSEASIAKRSLKAVSIAITLISIITFSTISYSAYAEYQALTALSGKDIGISGKIEGSKVILSVTGNVPNKGLYPLDIQLSLVARQGNRTISQSDSNVIRVLPNEVKSSNWTVSLDILSSVNQSQLSRLILNGSNIELLFLIKGKLEPFAGIAFGQRSELKLQPLIKNLTISEPKIENMDSRQVLSITLSFVNNANYQLPFTIKAELRMQGVDINSSVYSNYSKPGEISNIKLYFDVEPSKLREGPYELNFFITVFDKSFSIQKRGVLNA